MALHGTILDHFNGQAKGCRELGSPFTAVVCEVLAQHLDESSRFGARVIGWPGQPRPDALALRAAGALHALARAGDVPELSAAYPPADTDPEQLRSGIAAAIDSRDQFLSDYLDSPPQTNEVSRSSVVLGAALLLAAEMDLPIEVLEIGSSAGLNLQFDHYAYQLGEARWDPPVAAPLRIHCDWRGALPPLQAPLQVAARAGCDRNPLDPGHAGDRARLVSYVWADQEHRLGRLQRALDFAAAQPVRVENADAAEWVTQRLGRPAVPGRVRLLFHTVVWQYLPAAVQDRIEARLAEAGERASREAPLARFAMESDGTDPGARLSLTLWPGGATRVLGRADWHGRWVDWRPEATR